MGFVRRTCASGLECRQKQVKQGNRYIMTSSSPSYCQKKKLDTNNNPGKDTNNNPRKETAKEGEKCAEHNAFFVRRTCARGLECRQKRVKQGNMYIMTSSSPSYC